MRSVLRSVVIGGWSAALLAASISPHSSVYSRVHHDRAPITSVSSTTETSLGANLRLTGATLVPVDLAWAEALIRFLANPIVSTLLLSLGVLGLLTEIKAGAHGVGLVVGMAALFLFFGSSLLLGLSGMGTIIVLGIGLALLGIEVFLIPGHGFSGVLGMLLVGAAMVMAMLGPSPTAADLAGAFAVIAASVVITGAVTYGFIRHLPSSGRFSGLLHKGSLQSSEGFVAALPRTDLVGQAGIALTDLRPSGTAQVGSERIDVVTEGGYVSAGSAIEVVGSEGYRHIVRGTS